jgi:hypothetical protein
MGKKAPLREPAPDVAGMAEPVPREARQALCATVLATIAERLERQRAALLSRDPGAIARSFEALVPLLGDLSIVVRTADGEGPEPGPLGDLVRRIRDEIRLNQMLTAHGTAIADHFVLCVAHASPTISPALFSEVA